MKEHKLTKADVFNAIVLYGDANDWETDYDHALQAATDVILFERATCVEQLDYDKLDLMYNIYYA